MAELEETWTEQSFYDKPLAVWLAEEGSTNPLPLDIFTAASIGCSQRVKDIITESVAVHLSCVFYVLGWNSHECFSIARKRTLLETSYSL